MNFPLWSSVFLLRSWGVPICVVHVGVILYMGVLIYRENWVHTFAWRDQQFFDDHSSSLV